MSLIFVRGGAPPFVRHFDLIEGEDILIFDPIREFSSKSIGDRFRELDPVLRTATTVIFRASGKDIIKELSNDVVLKALLRPSHVAALVGTGSDADGLVGYCEVPGFVSPEWLPSLDFIRSLELRTILEQADAILMPPDNHHFSLPSGLHAEKFIRLGDALLEAVALSRIADWLVPFLDSSTVVVGDTRALLPLLMELRNRLRLISGRDLHFDILPRYPEESFPLIDIMADLSRRVPEGKILLLLSVEASGRLNKVFRSLAPTNSLVITICNSNEESTSDVVLLTLQLHWKNRMNVGRAPKAGRLLSSERSGETSP